MTTEGEPSAGDQAHITFNIKSSNDQKYVVTVAEAMTVQELKQKLATPEYADVPPERQRLIYSGRVLKDPDTLASYKIKDGNTVHMVKSAASNQQRNPANQSSNTSSSNPASAAVPQNIAAGTGNDPLAGLTGARYAGFAQLPGANAFGADGGLGPNPNDPEEMLRMLENPMFVQQMNEAMNNPAAIQMMQQHPMIRNNPAMREMLNSPEFRRMMLDPEMIRMSMRMAGNRGMFGEGGQNSMPAPGVTDTTPGQEGGTAASPTDAATSPTPGQNNTTPGADTGARPPMDPFSLFGQQAMGQQGGGANPWAALFGAPPGNMGNTQNNTQTSGPTAGDSDSNQQQTQTGQQQSQQQPPPNPFAQLFGGMGNMNQGPDGQQQSPMAAMTERLMQNPQLMNSLMQGMMGGSQEGQGGFNPMGGLFGAPPAAAAAAPPDNRPPEELYADQLRQLNDMGFHDFDRNVQALRRAGGSVQGAIESLLGGS